MTFVSPSEAFVLGTAPGYGTLVVRTLDRGDSWTRLSAPSAPLSRPGLSRTPAVWGVRFATAQHGFVFGSGLSGDDRRRYALVEAASTRGSDPLDGRHPRPGAGPDYQQAPGVQRDLAAAPLGGGLLDDGRHVKNMDLTDPTDLISTQAGTAAVLDGAAVLVTPDGGRTHALVSTPTAPAGFGPALVAVTSSTSLALLEVGQGYTGHTDKLVYTSANAGASWVKAGRPSNEGDGESLGGSPPATDPGHRQRRQLARTLL